ncbi:hypothetical protein V5F72_24000 [Xanthobacter flavus]|uniref:hypothetical protein n=1 Tax=Xanthobacter flavus TaxID=281 RepID=UPI00372AA3AF
MSYDDYLSIHGRKLGVTRSQPTRLVLDGVAQPLAYNDPPVLPSYDVAGAPSAAASGAGTMIFVTNGAAGAPIVAYSDGANWKRVDTGATIAAA